MIRVQNLVPEVYPEQSRDFQMFCRLFDVAFNSVKQAIDSMQNITSTQLCDASVLGLLQTKIGFFSSLSATDEDMRMVLSAFPHIIRYKGSRRAIDYIVNLYARLVTSSSSSSSISVDMNKSEYVIEVSSEQPVTKTELILELLRYVIPTGYIVDYYITQKADTDIRFTTTSKISYNISNKYTTKIVIKKDELQDVIEDGTTYVTSRDLSSTVGIPGIADV